MAITPLRAAGWRTAGSSPAGAPAADAPPPASRRCRRASLPAGRQIREQIGGFGVQPFVPARRHRLLAQVDAARRDAGLAHHLQKLAAPAADIQHVPAAGEVRQVELLAGLDVFFRRRGSARRSGRNRTPSGAPRCRLGSARAPALPAAGAAILRRAAGSVRSSEWISRSYSSRICSRSAHRRCWISSACALQRGREIGVLRAHQCRGSWRPSGARCWKPPCRSATLRRNWISFCCSLCSHSTRHSAQWLRMSFSSSADLLAASRQSAPARRGSRAHRQRAVGLVERFDRCVDARHRPCG